MSRPGMNIVRDGLLREWLRQLTFVAKLVLDSAVVLVFFLVTRAFGLMLTSGDPQCGQVICPFADCSS